MPIAEPCTCGGRVRVCGIPSRYPGVHYAGGAVVGVMDHLPPTG